MKRGFRSEVVVGLCVLVIFVLGAIFFTDVPPLERLHSLRTWQEADTPPGYPVDVEGAAPDGRIPAFDGRFVLLDGFERFRIPPVSRLMQPLHTGLGTLRPDPRSDRGRGDPVFAVGNGVVGYAADRGGAEGRVILIGHRMGDGKIGHSRYANLKEIEVAQGTLVARGQRIGTIARAAGGEPASLHFEMVEGPLLDPDPVPGQTPPALPAGSSPTDLAPEPLAIYEAEAQVFRIGPNGIPVPLEK